MGILEFKSVKALLDRRGIPYEVLEHAPVYTSEQAAKVRGVELKTGVKALVLRGDKQSLVVGLVAADRKIDLKKLAEIAGSKKLQLASPQEVFSATGCEVGSVHPFGNLLGLVTYMDRSVLGNDMVNFNVGLHTVSIQMKARDLIKAIKPVVVDFSK